MAMTPSGIATIVTARGWTGGSVGSWWCKDSADGDKSGLLVASSVSVVAVMEAGLGRSLCLLFSGGDGASSFALTSIIVVESGVVQDLDAIQHCEHTIACHGGFDRREQLNGPGRRKSFSISVRFWVKKRQKTISSGFLANWRLLV